MKKLILLFLFYMNSAISNNEDFVAKQVVEKYPNSKYRDDELYADFSESPDAVSYTHLTLPTSDLV